MPALDRQPAIWQCASMTRKAIRLTQDQRNMLARREALDQYTRALQAEVRSAACAVSAGASAARCFFARAVLLEALGA